GTFAEGMYFDYPYQQGQDNSVDIIDVLQPGSQIIMGSDPKAKWIYGRATSYSRSWKGQKATPHNNVYLTFAVGSLKNGIYPSTQCELTRRILAFQGYNVEPEPVVDLVDSAYTGGSEGAAELSWTAVNDDASTKTTKYLLKFSEYDPSLRDLGKISSETDFLDTALTYYQTWAPLAPKTLEKKVLTGLPPADTLIFTIKAGDGSAPTRWGTLGDEPLIVVSGDTVTPHSIGMGYAYGCVNDFIKSERIDIRNGDTLYTTWDASSLYLGYTRCDWRTQGDLFIYFDTRSGGADSTCPYNAGDSCSGFDPAFRPDFCLIVEDGSTGILKKCLSGKNWVDSINPYTTGYLYLDSINKYTYQEIRVPFAYLKYTVGNVFKYLVVCADESDEHSWNAFPPANNIGKGAKAPLAKYPYFYQINSLAAGISPRSAARPLAVELADFACQSSAAGATITWQTSSERDNYAWLVERSDHPDGGYTRIATVPSAGPTATGHAYSYVDNTAAAGSTYYYRLGDQDIDGAVTWHGPLGVSIAPVPATLSLAPCRPNPAHGGTAIGFTLPRAMPVALAVYDVCGRQVRVLADGMLAAGGHSLAWDGHDDADRPVAAGVYFMRLTADGAGLTRKVVLLR
ncbi:MAG TPA: FlgD immunoglobulin-like domain containing protein, partial [Candidatus Edwardsbacteria bacterium]|nr:FlgD immunoglobulin-like domain containing protein [Candidatus Edwardsbacteria bacterium]